MSNPYYNDCAALSAPQRVDADGLYVGEDGEVSYTTRSGDTVVTQAHTGILPVFVREFISGSSVVALWLTRRHVSIRTLGFGILWFDYPLQSGLIASLQTDL